jgi:DNA-binding CsgD family transcriptional regulator
MREVSVRMLHFELDLARIAGIDERELTDGLASIARPGAAQPRWIDWDDFAEVSERFERAVGGPGGVGRVMREALPVAYPEIRAFTAVFFHPIPLFTFVMTRLMRTMYRNITISDVERLDGERVRWTQSIPEPHRPCETFHRSTVSLVELFPRHLELPEAHLEEIVITPRQGRFVARFPAPPSFADRGARVVSSAASVVAEQLDAAFAAIADKLRADSRGDGAGDGDGDGGDGSHPQRDLDAWAERLKLSRRQRDVFALLVKGRANKDIAAALRCSERNVEFHVGRILRAARVTSRSELLVKVLGAPPSPRPTQH